jgi:DeoR family fructose operon transcriptional repressor
MFLDERLNSIMEILNKEKKVKVNDLAKQFNISEVMIRKDLQRLETEGKLKRTHGGAILKKEIVHLSTLDERLINKTSQKSIIAKKIYSTIGQNETIFLDVSSINYMVAELLAEEDKNIVLITNMPSISALFRKDSGTEIVITGGNYNKEIGGIVGSEAINCINKYKVDRAFLGSCGINPETGSVMNFQSEDGNTKKAVLSISKKKYLIVETKKFECEGTFRFSSLDEFDSVITEKKPDQISSAMKKTVKKFMIEFI